MTATTGMPSLVTGSTVRRGEIRLADLEPVVGSEASKRRPVVVVSNDRANASADDLGRGVVTVVPLTSNVASVYAFQTFLPAGDTGLSRDSKAQAEQVCSLAAQRIGPALGRLTPGNLAELDDALRLHLDL